MIGEAAHSNDTHAQNAQQQQQQPVMNHAEAKLLCRKSNSMYLMELNQHATGGSDKMCSAS